jgi:hypothetical protein
MPAGDARPTLHPKKLVVGLFIRSPVLPNTHLTATVIFSLSRQSSVFVKVPPVSVFNTVNVVTLRRQLPVLVVCGKQAMPNPPAASISQISSIAEMNFTGLVRNISNLKFACHLAIAGIGSQVLLDRQGVVVANADVVVVGDLEVLVVADLFDAVVLDLEAGVADVGDPVVLDPEVVVALGAQVDLFAALLVFEAQFVEVV